MKAAVIGLGVEGKKAVNSLLSHGWEVYATDLNSNVDLSDLELPMISMNLVSGGETVSIVSDNLTVDLGFSNSSAIEECDAIAISPSMYGGSFADKLLEKVKLLSNVVTKHKDIFTIGITGTNGKTTSVHMLKSILENAGKKVLVGGNGGGGFSGYYDLILEASNDDYDILLVEVCDMTLDFCNYCFDFDMVGLTNIGNDHMDVHKTIANYKNTLVRFFESKTVFTAFNQDFNALPDHVKKELQIMCVLYTEDVGVILTLEFDENVRLQFKTEALEADARYDEIGSGLKIKQLQQDKKELLESLEMYYKVFFLGDIPEEELKKTSGSED